ncbi:MAG: hypothetical protein RXR16_03160 [Thermocladium sp.]
MQSKCWRQGSPLNTWIHGPLAAFWEAKIVKAIGGSIDAWVYSIL